MRRAISRNQAFFQLQPKFRAGPCSNRWQPLEQAPRSQMPRYWPRPLALIPVPGAGALTCTIICCQLSTCICGEVPNISDMLNVNGKGNVGPRAGRRRHLRTIDWAIECVTLDGDAARFADQALEFAARGELGGFGAGIVINLLLDN